MIKSIILFFIGIICGFLLHKYVKISFNIPIKTLKPKNNNVEKIYYFEKGSKLDCINQLLNEIRDNKSLPIDISPVIMRSLKTIANTKNWDKKLDKESINNLYKIYNKWQQHIKAEQITSYSSAGKAEGFEELEEWEGTEEEYEKALANGIITPYTRVKIYTNTYLTMKEDGSIEEYMN